ncbi:helix-turn-helix transcriptional regulator [Thiothrix unzii]|jgi:transcriptional regulator with XRE-family HTH domain|uniref:helix-turn-helix domain-containing protein n=1 Tax=Thiothrix unzii TaxID=111769 RepID=UPI002A35B928|nr:helix-turn-helix transcriptional regulator [Thiothrix unzii]MDX9989036.1 helix-turn-helix transcriptional regulator [Thiothrix unzii]
MLIHDQIRTRRRHLGLTQAAMKTRIGMGQQQYQRIEAGGNANLDTLKLIADGLNAELMLIPRNRVQAVLDLLKSADTRANVENDVPLENPWQDFLADLYEETDT